MKRAHKGGNMTARPLTKLIIVDDDVDILKIMEFSLEFMEGVTIKYCHSGREGIAEALEFQPDLMLVDVMMPVMNGIELLHEMRLNPSLTHIPVVFLTAKLQKNEVDVYHKIGVEAIIAKPFDPISLPDTIRTLWAKISGAATSL